MPLSLKAPDVPPVFRPQAKDLFSQFFPLLMTQKCGGFRGIFFSFGFPSVFFEPFHSFFPLLFFWLIGACLSIFSTGSWCRFSGDIRHSSPVVMIMFFLIGCFFLVEVSE